MSLLKIPVVGFLKVMRVTPWGWLIGVWVLHILLGKLLAAFPSWYIPVCLVTAVYGALSRAKWSFIRATIWWLVFLVSLGEFLIALVVLWRIDPLIWPRPSGTFFYFEPLIVGFGILVLVKFVTLVFFPVGQFIAAKLLRINYSQHRRALRWALTFLVAMTTAAVACWHWRLVQAAASESVFSLSAVTQLSFAAAMITVWTALYIALLMLFFAVVVVPISRGGVKLKQSGTQLQAFIILAWTSGLGLWLGWIAGAKP